MNYKVDELKYQEKVEKYNLCLNKYVRKKSGRPFKSGLKQNRVKCIVKSKFHLYEPTFIFYEDNSLVKCKDCELVQKIFYYL